MSMTREDVLRELELLPIWTLRAPLPTQANIEPKTVLVDSVEVAVAEAIEELVIERPPLIANPAVFITSDDKKWLFVLPDELTNQAADLFNNILRALHINKTQTSQTRYLTQDIANLGTSVVIVMGEAMAQQLLASAESIETLRGKIHLICGLKLIATYHPNELLQHQANKVPNKAKSWDDLCLAIDAMNA